MAQHFLLSSKAVTLSVTELARLSDDDAYEMFKKVRFAENDGEPYCPHCGCPAVYTYKARRLFKCKQCDKQFTATSGTAFRSRKKSYGDILVAILSFVNGVNGNAALHIRRDIGCSYKTAFVMVHKLRRAMASMQAENELTGEVDIDGVYIGGHIRQANMKADRTSDGREYNAKRRSIVTMRERRPGGRSRAIVVANEKAAVPTILRVVKPSAHVFTDEGGAFSKFYIPFADHKTVNHSQGLMIKGVHINPIEAQHSRIRRAERGVYLKISLAHAQRYADELSWRDDHRRVSNGQQFRSLLGRAAMMRPDAELTGYWQKRPDWLMDLKRRRGLRELTQRRRGRLNLPISFVGRASI